MGQYALNLSGEHPKGECMAQTDAGPLPLAVPDAGSVGATLCFGKSGDGGPQLELVIAGKGMRTSDLFPDGGFQFVSPTTNPTGGIACGAACLISIDEKLSGGLQTPGDAGFALEPDGGLPPLTGFSGTLSDELTTPDVTQCSCNLPCAVSYAVSGTR